MAHTRFEQEDENLPLRLVFVAELFSKLSKEDQDCIISLIKALLSHK